MLGWGPRPQDRAEGSRGRYRAAKQEGSQRSPSPEAAEKVGVGVSRPREEEREEVGEVRRIIPLLPALWLTAGRESKEANWFAAQNSEGWGWSGGGSHLSSGLLGFTAQETESHPWGR